MRRTFDPSRLNCGPLLGAGLLVFVAMFSLCAQCGLHGDPTDDVDWEDAATEAVERAKPTDGIRVHPTWTETPLPHLQPVGNLLHRHREPLLEDLVGITRLLILTQSNRRDEALERLPFDASTGAVDTFDTVELLTVEVPPELRIETDATPLLADADVAVYEGDDVDSTCRRVRRDSVQWRCDYTRVYSTLREVEDDPRRCITAHPPSGDRHIAVELTIDEPANVLRVRAGLDNRAARLPSGGDVIYRLYVDGERVANQHAHAHTSRWKPHDIPTAESGEPVELRVEVESVDPDPHHRRFCFNAWPLTDEQARR